MGLPQVHLVYTNNGTTTLTSSSDSVQYFTGTNNQTVKLPPTTGLSTGKAYEINNASSGILTLQYQDGTSFATFPICGSNSTITVTLQSISSTNGVWIVSGTSGGNLPGDVAVGNDLYVGQEMLVNSIVATTTVAATSTVSGSNLTTSGHASADLQIANNLSDVANPTTALANIMPSGVMLMFGGNTPPTGWVYCDGTSYPISTYPNLFAAIGYTFGGSVGVSYNVPNMGGNVPMGSSLTYPLGTTGGEAVHTLVTSEIPSHTHGYSGSSSGTTNSVVDQGLGSHTHNQGNLRTDLTVGQSSSANNSNGGNGIATSGPSSIAHEHGFTYAWSGTTDNGTGGNQAHNNIQPYVAVHYIIKT